MGSSTAQCKGIVAPPPPTCLARAMRGTEESIHLTLSLPAWRARGVRGSCRSTRKTGAAEAGSNMLTVSVELSAAHKKAPRAGEVARGAQGANTGEVVRNSLRS